jgi:hypothetical protein
MLLPLILLPLNLLLLLIVAIAVVVVAIDVNDGASLYGAAFIKQNWMISPIYLRGNSRGIVQVHLQHLLTRNGANRYCEMSGSGSGRAEAAGDDDQELKERE